MKTRVGLGYDIHPLQKGRPLVLGGVNIPHKAGLAGHSDGDALVHAIIDALVGASGEGDIGRLFPDTDPRYQNARSAALLQKVMARLKKKGIKVVNVDAVVVAGAPRLTPYVTAMKKTLGPILGIKEGDLGIKSKSNNGLGDIGRGRAIACWAVALVRKGR